MSAPEPVARVELPFVPNWLRWATGDDHLVAAEVGSAHGLVSITVDGSGGRYAPTAEASEFAGGTITAVAVSPERTALAIAEVIAIPGDNQFRRIRVHDLRSGRQRWFRNYAEADDLLIDGAGNGTVLARRSTRIVGRDLGTGDERWPGRPIELAHGPQYPWRLASAGAGGRLVAGAQPQLFDLATAVFLGSSSLSGDCHQIVHAGPDRVLVRGGAEAYESVEVEGGGFELVLAATSYVAELDARDLTVRRTIDRPSPPSLTDAAADAAGRQLALATGAELEMFTLPGLAPAAGFHPVTLGAGAADRRRLIRFSPDGAVVALNATRTGPGVLLVDARTGAGAGQLPGEVAGFEFSPSGRLLAVTSGRSVSIYDVDQIRAETWRARGSWDLPGAPAAVAIATITTHPQGESGPYVRRRIGAVGSHDAGGGFERFGTIGAASWDYTPQTGKPVAGIAFNPNRSGDYAVWRVAGPKYLTYYNSANVELLRCPVPTKAGSVTFLDDRRLLAVGIDLRARIFDIGAPAGPLEAKLVAQSPAMAVGLWYGAAAPDLSLVALCGSDRSWLVNAQDASPVHPAPIVHGGDVTAVAFDPVTAARLYVGHERAAVDVVDTATGRIERQIGHAAPVTQVAVRGDGRLMLTVNGTTVRAVTLPAPGGPDELRTFDAPVTKVGFHPRDSTAFVATEEPGLVVFDLDTGSELWWTPLPGVPRDFAFDADGDILAVACDRGVHLFARRG
jgi:WD40 repeat protein